MLLDKPLRLIHGAGNGVDQACLMTAANMLRGKGSLGDAAGDCICPVLRAFIIPTNDAMPEDLLGELYGPLAWEIIGTKTDDLGVMIARGNVLSVAAQKCAALAAKYAKSAKSAASAAYAAKSAAYAAAYAAASAAYAAADAKYAASAAYAAKSAAYKARSREIWTICRDAIREAAAVGDKRPVECVLSREQLCEKLAAAK